MRWKTLDSVKLEVLAPDPNSGSSTKINILDPSVNTSLGTSCMNLLPAQ